MAAPINNDFANATIIGGEVGSLPNQTNFSASSEVGEPATSAGCTVWYKWTAPYTDYYQFYTITNPAIPTFLTGALNTYLQVFTGSSFPLTEMTYLTPWTYNANWANYDLGSLVAFKTTGGSSYYIRVGGYGNASPRNQNYGSGSGAQGNFNLSWAPFRISHQNSCAAGADNNSGIGYNCIIATASLVDAEIFNGGPTCFGMSPNPYMGNTFPGGVTYPVGGFGYGTYKWCYKGGSYNCFYFPSTTTGSQADGAARWIVEGGGVGCNGYNASLTFNYVSASTSQSAYIANDLTYWAPNQFDVNQHYHCSCVAFLHTGGDMSMQWNIPGNPFSSFNFLCYQNGQPNPNFALYLLSPVITPYNVPGACAAWTTTGSGAASVYFNLNNQNDITWPKCTLTLDTTFGGITAASTWTGSLTPGLNTIPLLFTSSVGTNCTARLKINSVGFATGVNPTIDYYLGPTVNVSGPTVISCRGGLNGSHFQLTYTGAWTVKTVKYLLQSSTGTNLNDVFPDTSCNLGSLTTGSVYPVFDIGTAQCIETHGSALANDFYTIRFFGTNRQISASFVDNNNTSCGASVIGGISNI